MIIWIASYPKSGNTWVRSLLSAYLYSDDGVFNFSLLDNINQFPSRKFFEYFLSDFTDIKKVSNYWIAAQDRINLYNDKPVFLKTHSALCTFEKNIFTNPTNTKAVIHVVRDPRNVITSLAHHYSEDIEGSYKFMTTRNMLITKSEWGSENFGIATVIGSWGEHYKSWKTNNFSPMLLVRYEDLINDTKKTFKDILKFLGKIMEVKIDDEKISNAVRSCSFENLSTKEDKDGFDEQSKSKKDNKNLKFFYLGAKNNWKNILDEKMEKNIRTSFNQEMKDLNYI